MKETKVKFTGGAFVDPEGNEYRAVDWSNASEEVFEEMDKELADHGLEILLGDSGDSGYWFCVVKRKEDGK